MQRIAPSLVLKSFSLHRFTSQHSRVAEVREGVGEGTLRIGRKKGRGGVGLELRRVFDPRHDRREGKLL